MTFINTKSNSLPKEYKTSEEERIRCRESMSRYLGTYKGRLSNICKNIKERSELKGLEFDLDRPFLYALYENQSGRCAISGIEFDLVNNKGRVPFSISVDRIDSNKGYIKSNVRLVCSMANFAKNIWTDHDLHLFCKKVVEHGDL